MEIELISIVIPAYNAEKFVKRAISSILNQTYQGEVELIVVDDGSKDGTAQEIKSFPKPVRYIYQENQGESAARNKGIAEANGEWIAFLDADDEYLPGTLELFAETLKLYPEAKAISGACNRVYSDGNIITYPQLRIFPENKEHGILSSFFNSQRHGIVNSSSVMITKSVFAEVGGFNVKLETGPDLEMWAKVGGNYPWCFVNKEVSNYIITEDSVTQNISVAERSPDFVWNDEKMKQTIAVKNWSDYRAYRLSLMLNSAYICFSESQFIAARKFLRRIKPAPMTLRRFIAFLIAYLPGGSLLYRLLKKMK